MPALVAVHQDASGKRQGARAGLRQGHRRTRAGVIETTFREETETDLFGEQAVLCGGVSAADQGRLRDAGRGRLPAGDGLLRVPARAEADRRPDLRRAASATCATRSATPPSTATTPPARGSSTSTSRTRCASCSTDIQDGTFAREWILENQAGRPSFLRDAPPATPSTRSRSSASELRAMMPWLQGSRTRAALAAPSRRARRVPRWRR